MMREMRRWDAQTTDNDAEVISIHSSQFLTCQTGDTHVFVMYIQLPSWPYHMHGHALPSCNVRTHTYETHTFIHSMLGRIHYYVIHDFSWEQCGIQIYYVCFRNTIIHATNETNDELKFIRVRKITLQQPTSGNGLLVSISRYTDYWLHGAWCHQHPTAESEKEKRRAYNATSIFNISFDNNNLCANNNLI